MRTIFIGLLLTLPPAVQAADEIRPLNIKPGLWETTMTTTTNGEMPVSDELLSRMTPQQRAAFEARMKANSGGRTTTITSKSCITKEDVEKVPSFGKDNEQCTQTILSSTSSKADIRMVCDGHGMKGSGTMHLEAINQETMKASGQTTANGNGHTLNINMSITSKWLGPVCGNVSE